MMPILDINARFAKDLYVFLWLGLVLWLVRLTTSSLVSSSECQWQRAELTRKQKLLG